MNFDVYMPFKNRSGQWCPGVKPKSMSVDEIASLMNDVKLIELVGNFQKTKDTEYKKQLPAVCWTGKCNGERRKDEDCVPTQFVMIDIDHCKKPPREVVTDEMIVRMKEENLALIHITPSGEGLRLIFRAKDHGIDNLSDYMLFLDEAFGFHNLGGFDPSVKNVSRLSFLVPGGYVLYWNSEILSGEKGSDVNPIVRAGESITQAVKEKKNVAPSAPKAEKKEEEKLEFDGGVDSFTAKEIESFNAFRYRGYELKQIIDKYLEVFGEPGPGERHNYYNEMVKNFRCICDNNKRLLLYFLPRFGHTIEECASQITSICRVNTLSRLPRTFYFFLKDNGFYETRFKGADDLKKYMLDETEVTIDDCPYFPPVFRELAGSAPKDFIVPMVNSLLPILGTLTSYVRSVYPYDMREHSTSFFSVIYAPPGTGKGFVERFMDLLFSDLKLRDFVQSERENVYLRMMIRKGANDKSPDAPHVSLRLIPPKNSEAEFLQKQRDNHGYHMFTYAAEMDSWAKGVRAAGGNKDDMVRIAWDNGEYGQQFKSFNTFKGTVKLYWNVLITGTIQQVENYFKNVENGLVTRCSFCSIENQEFAPAPVWKPLTKRGLEVVKRFVSRCDENTYEKPCTIDPDDLLGVNDDDFDKEVDWRFKFKDKKEIDMSWIMPVIDNFHEEQMKLAALDIDRARDVFRRRVAVRGFRLGMICYCLWENPRNSDLEKCKQFINWWMHKDLENILGLWGAKYNEQTDYVPHVVQRTVFDALGIEFTRNDVYDVCLKQGIKTPVRRIIHDWKKLKYVEALSKEKYKKIITNK